MQHRYRNALLVSALVFVFNSASAQDFIVNNNADVPDASPGDGVCNPVNAVPGVCTLRAAVMEANALDNGPHLIALPSGTYTLDNEGEDEDGALTGDLDITSNIRILNGTANPPLISGNASDRIFDLLDGSELELENVALAFGVANTPLTVRGGAVQVREGARLALDTVRVSLNLANQGGAIYSDGVVSIQRSEILNNAILAEHLISEFSDGAAIFNRGQLLVGRSTIRDNGKIPGFGVPLPTNEFAIHSRPGFAKLISVAISNSTIFGNTNGVFSDGVLTSISSSTVVENNQRGLRFLPDVDNLEQVQLNISQSVFFGHQASDCNALNSAQSWLSVSERVNASSDESCGFDGGVDFQNIQNPFFGGLSDNGGPTLTLMPRSTSILVDPEDGSCSFVITTDQRGSPRQVDGNDSGQALCDIGSVEYQPGDDPEFTDQLFSDRFQQQ